MLVVGPVSTLSKKAIRTGPLLFSHAAETETVRRFGFLREPSCPLWWMVFKSVNHEGHEGSRRTTLGGIGVVRRALRPDGSANGLAGVFALGAAHAMQNGREDVFVSHGGVNHHVVQRTGRPVGAEIMLHEQDALTIHGIYQVVRVF